MAASEGVVESIQLLLDNGADITARDNEGKNALLLAIVYNRPEAIKDRIEIWASGALSSRKRVPHFLLKILIPNSLYFDVELLV